MKRSSAKLNTRIKVLSEVHLCRTALFSAC